MQWYQLEISVRAHLERLLTCDVANQLILIPSGKRTGPPPFVVDVRRKIAPLGIWGIKGDWDSRQAVVSIKVGHHAAAGATPGTGGLDLMTHPDLIAMLPIDAGFAARAGWNMPDPDLLDRLLRVTRGRLVRSDQSLPDRPDGASAGEWEAVPGGRLL